MNMVEKIPTLEEFFRPGNPVHIDFVTDKGEKIYIPSRIHKVDLLFLTLELKEYTGAINRLAFNHTVTLISFLGHEPRDYVFFTKFIRLTEGDPTLMMVSMPDNFHLGRQSIRRETNIPFSYYCNNEQEYKDGVVCNISRTGLLVSVKPDDQLAISQNIPFKISLPSSSIPLSLTGKIVRIEKQEQEYKIALSFRDINALIHNQL